MWRLTFVCLLVVVSAKPKDEQSNEGSSEEDICEAIKCIGKGYECFNGQCYCALGYIPNPFQNRCIKCPSLGDKCHGPCCNENITLTCWQGVCQECHDPMGQWICREPLDHMLLITSTQIAMATALVLGIIATFMLLYKLCAATTNLSRILSCLLKVKMPLGSSGRPAGYEGRLSIGSLQLYVEERLRDAPPSYTRQTPPGTTVVPATVYVNTGFINDCSVPPPPYTPAKIEDDQHPTVHI